MNYKVWIENLAHFNVRDGINEKVYIKVHKENIDAVNGKNLLMVYHKVRREIYNDEIANEINREMGCLF